MSHRITTFTAVLIISTISLLPAQNSPAKSDSTTAFDSTKKFVRQGYYLKDQKQYKKAIGAFKQAVEFFSGSDRQTPLLWSVLYNNIGSCYQGYGAKQPSLKFYQLALEQMHRAEKPDVVIYYRILRSLGEIYTEKRYYALGEKYFSEALSLTQKHPALKEMMYPATEELGIVYYYKEEYERAQRLYRKCLNHLEKMGFSKSDPDLLDNIAANFRKMNQPDSSLHYLRRELEVRNRMKDSLLYLKAKLYSDLGETHQLAGNPLEAERYFIEGIELANNSNPPYDVFAHYYMKYVLFLRDQGRFQEGLSCLKEAKDRLTIEMENATITAHPEDFINILADEGGIYTKLFEKSRDTSYLFAANNAYREALDRIKALNNYSTRQNIQSQNTDYYYTVYERYLHFLSQYGNLTGKDSSLQKAFHVMEQSKNIQLLENTNAGAANHIAGIPDSLIQQRKQFEDSIQILKNQLIKFVNEENQFRKLQSKLLKKESRYHTFTRKLYQKYPDYYALIYPENTMSLDRLQAEMLRTGDLFIEYFMGDSHCIALFITPWSKELVRISSSDTVDQLTNRFDSLMQHFPQLSKERTVRKKYRENFSRTAHRLFQKMMPEQNLNDIDRLIVVPDGAVHRIPFESLLTDTPKAQYDYCQWPYLIQSTNLLYQYSGALWRQMKREKYKDSDMSILFAADFGEEHRIPIRGVSDSMTLSALPYSSNEVTALGEILNGRVYTDSQALKTHFIEEMPGTDIAHLATHAVLNDRFPSQSFIAFSQNGQPLDSSFLYFNELLRLHLPVDLVTLNSCSTYKGPYQPGSGISCISKGFAYAGAHSLIATRWAVSDQKANAVMEQTYSSLLNGATKTEALGASIRTLSTDCDPSFSHPYYWSNYLLIGSANPVYTGRGMMFYLIWGVALMLLVGLIVGIRFIRT